jgi:hypothetical protein
VWRGRPAREMCEIYIRGSFRGGGEGDCENGADSVVLFHGLERRRIGAEGEFCDQLRTTEPELAELICRDGNSAGIFINPGEEKLPNDLGCKFRVSSPLRTPLDARLLYIPLWGAHFQMYCTAIWIGSICDMVHEADETSCQANQEIVGVPIAFMD